MGLIVLLIFLKDLMFVYKDDKVIDMIVEYF